MATPRLLLLCLLAFSLAACGWQLRGAGASLEGRTIYVQSAISGDMPLRVKRGLQLTGAEVTDSAEAAEAVLVLAGERLQRRAASLSASARVQEYELSYTLSFSLQSAEGKTILSRQDIGVAQVYRHDRTDVLGSQSQADVVAERLRQDTLRLLLPRVQAALRQQP